MAFHYLTNVPLGQARREYAEKLAENGFAAPSETLPVTELAGRIAAEAIYARISAPHYPASAMDGIAVHASYTFGATETTPVTLTPDMFTVVDTGDPVPADCDAVVMVEDVIRSDDGTVKLYSAAAPWQHIRQIGEDICAGEMIIPAFMRISPSAVGAMLAGGVMSAKVLKKPVVGIIPTGDEIVPPSENPKPGDIPEFNSSIFSGMLRQWDAEPVTFPIVPDRRELIRAALQKALSACDMVILNAGSSAGREDFSSEMIGEAGGVLYHGIAIKPGKPAILGYCGKKPVIGVPGYPVSGILVLEKLFRPLINVWYHQPPEPEKTLTATLTRTVVSGLKYEEFVRVRMGCVGDKLMATPLSRGSGVVTSFMKADGIMTVPQGVEGYEAGEKVSVTLLKPEEALKNTLVAIGSHAPLLDEAANFLHAAAPELYMSSSHVGSMGGIMAIKRGEAHIAGVHLLDESDGRYNFSYIKKYFPNGGVHLVECVGRLQGLMLQKGNPKGITAFSDLTKAGVRYVNRQKGSGTRILTDYLCRTGGIDASSIFGYDREELTHTSVAAQIANDTADAGMGIYSAAQLYGLDFIPICTEQYDILVSDSAWDTSAVRRFIEILKSDEFRERLNFLGGYTITNPGTEREI